ncbi:MAG TPA: hypothetical protein VMS93_06575, partial [Candidatus Saccharimonadales bacterium]|nr:hypothetical protein [Candidatus Saccharimonadales bacterium]
MRERGRFWFVGAALGAWALLIAGAPVAARAQLPPAPAQPQAQAPPTAAPAVLPKPTLEQARGAMAVPSHGDVRGRIDSTGYA